MCGKTQILETYEQFGGIAYIEWETRENLPGGGPPGCRPTAHRDSGPPPVQYNSITIIHNQVYHTKQFHKSVHNLEIILNTIPTQTVKLYQFVLIRLTIKCINTVTL